MTFKPYTVWNSLSFEPILKEQNKNIWAWNYEKKMKNEPQPFIKKNVYSMEFLGL